MSKPVPWEIARQPGLEVASNGAAIISVRGGRVFLRRAIKGVGMGPGAVDRIRPKLNELSGELMARPEMPPEELRERLAALAGLAHVEPPEHVEWAVAELDGVRAYFDGVSVILTREDMKP
jgi:hypothetical protein